MYYQGKYPFFLSITTSSILQPMGISMVLLFSVEFNPKMLQYLATGSSHSTTGHYGRCPSISFLFSKTLSLAICPSLLGLSSESPIDSALHSHPKPLCKEAYTWPVILPYPQKGQLAQMENFSVSWLLKASELPVPHRGSQYVCIPSPSCSLSCCHLAPQQGNRPRS